MLSERKIHLLFQSVRITPNVHYNNIHICNSVGIQSKMTDINVVYISVDMYSYIPPPFFQDRCGAVTFSIFSITLRIHTHSHIHIIIIMTLENKEHLYSRAYICIVFCLFVSFVLFQLPYCHCQSNVSNGNKNINRDIWEEYILMSHTHTRTHQLFSTTVLMMLRGGKYRYITISSLTIAVHLTTLIILVYSAGTYMTRESGSIHIWMCLCIRFFLNSAYKQANIFMLNISVRFFRVAKRGPCDTPSLNRFERKFTKDLWGMYCNLDTTSFDYIISF